MVQNYGEDREVDTKTPSRTTSGNMESSKKESSKKESGKMEEKKVSEEEKIISENEKAHPNVLRPWPKFAFQFLCVGCYSNCVVSVFNKWSIIWFATFCYFPLVCYLHEAVRFNLLRYFFGGSRHAYGSSLSCAGRSKLSELPCSIYIWQLWTVIPLLSLLLLRLLASYYNNCNS